MSIPAQFVRINMRTEPEKKRHEPKGQAIGRSRGGPTTKIHLACDAKGRPINFRLSGGNVHDASVTPLGSSEMFLERLTTR